MTPVVSLHALPAKPPPSSAAPSDFLKSKSPAPPAKTAGRILPAFGAAPPRHKEHPADRDSAIGLSGRDRPHTSPLAPLLPITICAGRSRRSCQSRPPHQTDRPGARSGFAAPSAAPTPRVKDFDLASPSCSAYVDVVDALGSAPRRDQSCTLRLEPESVLGWS